MPQKPIVLLLVSALALPAQTGERPLKETVLGTPAGSVVEVRLQGKLKPNKVRGRLGADIDNESFQLEPGGGSGARTLAFVDLKAFKVVRPRRKVPVEKDLPARRVAAALPQGSLVEVQFGADVKPRRIRARFAGTAGDELRLQVFESGNIRERTVRFADVVSLQPADNLQIESKPTKVARGVGTGVAVALGAAGVMVVVGIVYFVVGRSRNP